MKIIPIEELEEYGYIYIRDQPCKIIHAIKQQNQAKHGKSEEPGRVKWQIEASNVFTNKEVYKGQIKGEDVKVPVVSTKQYEVVYASNGDSEIRVIDMEDEDCEEREDLELPVEDNPNLTKRIREAVNDGKDVLVLVLSCMGRDVIIDMAFME